MEREQLVSKDEIAIRVRELGTQITNDYKDKNLLVVGVLKGSFIFMADLVREIKLEDIEIDFIEVQSYGQNMESSRNPKFTKDLNTDIEGRHVLLVEDIVDTGYSFKTLLAILNSRNPASIKTCALLSKPDKREVEVPIDYLGFTIGDKWVEGYGIDTKERFRGQPNITSRT